MAVPKSKGTRVYRLEACNVLRIWTILAIPTCRVYRLYDYYDDMEVLIYKWAVSF